MVFLIEVLVVWGLCAFTPPLLSCWKRLVLLRTGHFLRIKGRGGVQTGDNMLKGGGVSI